MVYFLGKVLGQLGTWNTEKKIESKFGNTIFFFSIDAFFQPSTHKVHVLGKKRRGHLTRFSEMGCWQTPGTLNGVLTNTWKMGCWQTPGTLNGVLTNTWHFKWGVDKHLKNDQTFFWSFWGFYKKFKAAFSMLFSQFPKNRFIPKKRVLTNCERSQLFLSFFFHLFFHFFFFALAF